jgi:hypothetical protein
MKARDRSLIVWTYLFLAYISGWEFSQFVYLARNQMITPTNILAC